MLKSKNQDLLGLFEKLLSSKGKAFRHGEKYAPKVLYRYFDEIRDAIIHGIALSDVAYQGVNCFQIALRLGQFGYVRKHLATAIDLHSDRGEYQLALNLIELAEESRQLYGLEIETPMEKGYALALVKRKFQWDDILGKIRHALSIGPDGLLQGKVISDEIRKMEPLLDERGESFHHAKSQVGVGLILDNLHEAIHWQEIAVAALRDDQEAIWIKEMVQLSSLFLRVGAWESAQQNLWRMQNRPLHSLSAKDKREAEVIGSYIKLGLLSGRIEVAEAAIQELELDTKALGEKRTANAMHFISLMFLHEGRFAECLHWSRMLMDLPYRLRAPFLWSQNLIELLCHLEMGETDLADNQYKRAHRSLPSPARTPKLFLKAVRKTYFGSEMNRSEVEKTYQEILAISTLPEEMNAARYFMFREFLEAKLQGKTVAEILRETPRNYQQYQA